MPNKYKGKTYKGHMINGSEKLNKDLTYIRHRTDKPNRILLEEIFCPLSAMLKTKYDASYYVVIQEDQIIIKMYSRQPLIFSGIATAPLGDILGHNNIFNERI